MKETKHYCTPTRNIADHRTFGGLIYESDFCTNHRGQNDRESKVASNIAADLAFDHMCSLNAVNRNYRKSHKTEGVA